MTASPPSPSSLRRDASFGAVFAGFLAMFVGLSGTLALLFQAAAQANLSPVQTASWITAVCLAIGVSGIVLSWRFRAPVVTAFSTPGLALLAQEAGGFAYPEVIGALLVTAALVGLLGFTGLFGRLTARIPVPLAAALLAGILLPFGLAVFRELPSHPALIGAMLGAYVLGRAFFARNAVPAALLAGLLVAFASGALGGASLSAAPPALAFTAPAFSLRALLVLALPMTLLALASQHLPGLAVLRANGYTAVPASPLVGWTGVASLLSAPFGAHTTTLAAITAALCAGPEAHPDPARRWVAGLASGVSYLLAALFAGVLAAVFARLPGALVVALAGLALTGSILSSLGAALADPRWRESALLTVLVSASGASFLGVGSAFWGLVVGGACALLLGRRSA